MRSIYLFFTFIFVFILGLSGLKAQNNLVGHDGQSSVHDVDFGFVTRSFDNRYEGSKGTPFLYPAWGLGTVKLKNGRSLDQVSLHYDVHEDLLIANMGGDLRVIDKGTIERFSLPDSNGKTVTFLKVSSVPALYDSKLDTSDFVRLVFKGKVTLYARYTKEFFKADYTGAYSSGRTYDYFAEPKTTFYMQVGDKPAEKVKKSVRKVVKLFPSEQMNDLEAFAEENQLDLGEEAGLIKLIKFYEGSGQ